MNMLSLSSKKVGLMKATMSPEGVSMTSVSLKWGPQLGRGDGAPEVPRHAAVLRRHQDGGEDAVSGIVEVGAPGQALAVDREDEGAVAQLYDAGPEPEGGGEPGQHGGPARHRLDVVALAPSVAAVGGAADVGPALGQVVGVLVGGDGPLTPGVLPSPRRPPRSAHSRATAS